MNKEFWNKNIMELDIDVNKALTNCFNYKHSCAKSIEKKDCGSLLFLLDNFIQRDCTNPYALYLEVTSLCNLRCKHCFFGYDENNYTAKDDMTTEEILSLIDYMVKEYEICAVNIMGKEPFMRKDILTIIKHIKKHNLYLRIQTNGTLINEKIKDELINILERNNDILHISIDGALEEIHDEIRGKGNFRKTKEVIKAFTKEKFNVLLAYTITAVNVSTLSNLYELCNEIGVKSVLLGLYNDYIEPKEDLIPSYDNIVLNCALLIEKIKSNNSKIFLDLSFLSPDFILNFAAGEQLLDEFMKKTPQKMNSLKCHNSERIAIMSNGDVYLCPSCQTTDKEYCMGNIREQLFKEIWDNRYKNIFFQDRILQKSMCKYCKYLSLCKCGCMVSSYFTYKTMDAPSAQCKYYKRLEEAHANNIQTF